MTNAIHNALTPAGILVIDKMPGVTSARVVSQIKCLLEKKVKVGHAGTLDPFATGVLLILIGTATRLCEGLMDQEKEYEATVRLGATTITDDPEGEPRTMPITTAVEHAALQHALLQFVGRIQQVPPVFSALKIKGRPAYKLAREGRPPILAPRLVNIYSINLLAYEWPSATLRVRCGRGTYIRALARDLGAVLGVGGYLTALRRTAIGEYTVAQAANVATLTAQSIVERIIRPTTLPTPAPLS